MPLQNLKPTGSYYERIDARRLERVLQVEESLLKGQTNKAEIAKQYGISVKMVEKDIFLITREWKRVSLETSKQKRTKRVKQLENIVRLAVEGYYRSMEPEEEVTTTKSTFVCSYCRGSGYRTEDNERVTCPKCDGEGMVTETKVSTRLRGGRKGTKGDSSFLTAAGKAFQEIAKIEGIVIPNKLQIEGKVLHAHALTDSSGMVFSMSEILAERSKLIEERKSQGVSGNVIDAEFSGVERDS